MSKLNFKNYNFEFDKNEKKVLINFCTQVLKQMQNDERFFAEVKAIQSVISKLKSNEGSIKLTKDERTRLELQLKQNIKFVGEKLHKSSFIKKWLYKTVLKQYSSLYEKHFAA